MMQGSLIDPTHDAKLVSWVDSANDPESDFPPQNLPFGRFKRDGDGRWRVGVAIGDQILDLHACGLCPSPDIHDLLVASAPQRRGLRRKLSQGLQLGSAQESSWRPHLHAQTTSVLGLPCEIRDYTDFYIGIHHASAVGKLFRPDQPLLPNYPWVPIGYHGRASTIQVSGSHFHRPRGQIKTAQQSTPILAPTQQLDFELELGVVMGHPNLQGRSIPIAIAESHAFGLTLFNDWSARDIQAWEYQPLGPFLAKSFASTISPWIVTLEALAPFRQVPSRPHGTPAALPYLNDPCNQAMGAFDIDLEVLLQTPAMRAAGRPAHCLSRSNFAQAAYWTIGQLIAHHTVNGCSLATGDLLGTGTLSGPLPEQAGCLLELTQRGQRPIELPHGESRTFLIDGDQITLRASCTREGFRRIGFGHCTGQVDPARIE